MKCNKENHIHNLHWKNKEIPNHNQLNQTSNSLEKKVSRSKKKLRRGPQGRCLILVRRKPCAASFVRFLIFQHVWHRYINNGKIFQPRFTAKVSAVSERERMPKRPRIWWFIYSAFMTRKKLVDNETLWNAHIEKGSQNQKTYRKHTRLFHKIVYLYLNGDHTFKNSIEKAKLWQEKWTLDYEMFLSGKSENSYPSISHCPLSPLLQFQMLFVSSKCGGNPKEEKNFSDKDPIKTHAKSRNGKETGEGDERGRT